MFSLRHISRFIVSSILLSTIVSISTASTIRNANPIRSYGVVEVPVLFMNITAVNWTGPMSIPFQPTFGGTALPLSNKTDFSLDVPLMLPNTNDDFEGCGGAWNTTNEFGQSFNASGAFVLIRQSSCSYTTFLNAQASGAAGIIVYGCPGEKPYNCETQLHEVVITTVMAVPLIGISTADGEALVAFLLAARATANTTGIIPSVTTVSARFRSTSTIVPEERVALIAIMSQSVMNVFADGTLPDVLPLWNLTTLMDPTFDPCRPRLKGVWCEAGHIVMISIYYQSWYNFVPDYLPRQFGALTQLRYLNLQANAFGGAVPPEWCALTQLQSLWLDHQYRTPASITSLPDCVGNWTKLEELRLATVGLRTLPDAISSLTSLRKFVVSTNSLTHLPDISHLPQLDTFDCASNQLTALPTPHPSAPLQIYSIANNLIAGALPVDFFDGFANLQILDLNTNRFNGSMPNLLGCTSLTIMDLGSQRDIVADPHGTDTTRGFTGGMPLSWTACKNLQSLSLQENRLTGPMYAPLLQSLEYLDVSYNLFASDPTNTENAAGALVDSLISPSLITLRASGNRGIAGVLLRSNFQVSTTIRQLYLDHCSLTGLTKELYGSTLTAADFSYNNISREFISIFPIQVPPSTALLLDLRGNPFYTFDSLPAWSYPDTSSLVQATGSKYACPSLKVPSAPLMAFLVDPGFYQYQYCECASGTFGKPPLCSYVPAWAELNPLAIIGSSEIGPTFPTLIQQTGGVGGQLYAINGTAAAIDPSSGGILNTTDTFAQSFSDSMYGENRLTLGMSTSWVINLSNLFSDDTDDGVMQDGEVEPVRHEYVQNASLPVPDYWTPVRVVTVRLHISACHFIHFEDSLTIFEGGSDLKGTRIFNLRGSDDKPNTTSSAYTNTAAYLLQNNASISQIEDPRLIEVQVFTPMVTVEFTSRARNGLHFYATYSYDFECPSGYFYDYDYSPPRCQPNRMIFHVNNGIRAAVFVVSAIAFVWVIFNIIILIHKWDSLVYKAASRVFMLLILILLLVMPLGSLLYAAIPAVGTSSGLAICHGRAWLSCLPLAGVLAVILAKTNRLASIFGSTTLKSKQRRNTHILMHVLVVCSIQIGLLAIFSGLSLSRPILELGKGSLDDVLVTSCSQEVGFMSWFYAEVAFMAALMLPAAYLGFKTRDLPSQFNESTHIQNALVLLMFFGCIIIPLDIFIQDIPEAAVLIQGLGQAFLCVIMTAILFGPKLYYLSTLNSKDTRRLAASTPGAPTPDGKLPVNGINSIGTVIGGALNSSPSAEQLKSVAAELKASQSKQIVAMMKQYPSTSHQSAALSHYGSSNSQPSSVLSQDPTPIPPPNSINFELVQGAASNSPRNSMNGAVESRDATSPTPAPVSPVPSPDPLTATVAVEQSFTLQLEPIQSAAAHPFLVLQQQHQIAPPQVITTPYQQQPQPPLDQQQYYYQQHPSPPQPHYSPLQPPHQFASQVGLHSVADILQLFQRVHLDVQSTIDSALNDINGAELFIAMKKERVIQTTDIVYQIQMELDYFQQLTQQGVQEEQLLQLFQMRLQRFGPILTSPAFAPSPPQPPLMSTALSSVPVPIPCDSQEYPGSNGHVHLHLPMAASGRELSSIGTTTTTAAASSSTPTVATPAIQSSIHALISPPSMVVNPDDDALTPSSIELVEPSSLLLSNHTDDQQLLPSMALSHLSDQRIAPVPSAVDV